MPSKQQVGYCTNVHAGVSLEEVKANLKRYACEVKKTVSPAEAMPVGLWLANETIATMAATDAAQFRVWLDQQGLLAFTFNGFPFGDFHQPVVKHNVYLPTWAEDARLDYTVKLAELLAVLDAGKLDFATISTLPLGWPDRSREDESFLETCGKNLAKCAEALKRIHDNSGVQIMLCIEPEPGCVLDTASDVVGFFERFISENNREYIGVCHDICHSAVMFEPQRDAIELYHANAIRIGKCQVSSALEVDFDLDAPLEGLVDELLRFDEPRYLHQTCVNQNGKVQFFEDLGHAIDDCGKRGVWRTHFHVPISNGRVGRLGTTQSEIAAFLDHADVDSMQFEIETYAWDVLPPEAKPVDLQTSISKEIEYFRTLLQG